MAQRVCCTMLSVYAVHVQLLMSVKFLIFVCYISLVCSWSQWTAWDSNV